MESAGLQKNLEQFRSPEQELAFLREQVAKKEKELKDRGEANPLQERVIQDKIAEYQSRPADTVLAKEYQMPAQQAEAIVLELVPEQHDEKISELLGILQQHGLKNTLDIIERMNNPHLEDDFHRFIIQYIKAGHPLENLNPKEPIAKAMKMTLYEIALPEKSDKEETQKSLKELVSSMEQFYSGMLSVSTDDKTVPNYFTIELAVANHSDEFIFYASVPDVKKNLFEKQVLSIFYNARISEKKDDYNIFNDSGASVASVARLESKPALPIKLYDQFDHDPLNVILNSFSKIDRDGEGAAIQIVFSPAGDWYNKKYRSALDLINKGVKVKDAIDIPETFFEHFGAIFKGSSLPAKKKDGSKPEPEKVDEIGAEQVKRKIESPIVRANIRLIASSGTEQDALNILSDMESAFNQFENTHGNKFSFERLKKGKLKDFLKEYSFRLFSEADQLPLSLRELTTVMHLPSTVIKTSPQLKISKAGTAPAPLDLPQTGLFLGTNTHRNADTKIFMQPEDRLRHFYVIGQTGTGKTSLLKNMIVQDIKNGEGVCFIDPHGSDVQDILAKIPKERYEDVIYFDPAYTARPMALNMLEYDARFPEQKTFVVNEMLSIFNKLFDMKTAGGPMFEQYFRNAVLLTIDDPSSGGTLLDVSKVLSVKAFREQKLATCTNPIVIQFWKEVAEKAGGEASLANIVPYITSKFDTFLSNDIMRPVIAQEKSTFNFREIMDNKKILLVNLSKGRLGDINANLIGLILVGKILMAALSRVDSIGKNLPPFYLYIDEFQNITTDSISVILSEARKYKLSLNIAHQFIAQLQEGIKNSVFGNVGSMAAFRVGAEDAEYLEKQFSPVFTAKDIMNVDNYNSYIKMLSAGRPVKPFSMRIAPPESGRPAQVENLKELSYLKFGKDRSSVEAEIMSKYQKK